VREARKGGAESSDEIQSGGINDAARSGLSNLNVCSVTAIAYEIQPIACSILFPSPYQPFRRNQSHWLCSNQVRGRTICGPEMSVPIYSPRSRSLYLWYLLRSRIDVQQNFCVEHHLLLLLSSFLAHQVGWKILRLTWDSEEKEVGLNDCCDIRSKLDIIVSSQIKTTFHLKLDLRVLWMKVRSATK
jgi:hypothetical protein